jgi:hypothetical protein
MGEERKLYKFLVGKPEEKRDHSEDRSVDGIGMDLTETGWGLWSGLSWLRIGTGGRLL